MKKLLLTAFLVSILVFSAGCIENQIPNVDVNKKEEVETADVLVIDEIKTVPEAPIYPGSNVELIISLKNKDERKSIHYTLDLFDPSIFTVVGPSKKTGRILPSGEEIITFNITVPSSEDMKVKISPTVSFRVLYDLNTTTTYDIVIVNLDEIKNSQLADKTLSFEVNKVLGSGPIKIDMGLKGSSFLISGQKGVLELKVTNKGFGSLEESKIKSGNLKLRVLSDEFRARGGCIESTEKNTFTVTNCDYGENIADISMIGTETSPLLFLLKAPNVDLYRTYTLKADVSYTYEIRGSKSITITPIDIE